MSQLTPSNNLPNPSNPLNSSSGTYCAEITRNNPALIVLLIDQSGSMNEKTDYQGQTVSKAQAVADTTNRLIQELILRCTRDRGVNDYFELLLIGYGNSALFPLLKQNAIDAFVKISSLAANIPKQIPHQIEVKTRQGVVTKTEMRPHWIEPQASGNTPMRQAFLKTANLLHHWTNQHLKSFPPIVFNVTDGQATDIHSNEELIAAAQKIQQTRTVDGATLLFNINISTEQANPVIFPASRDQLPNNDYAHLLYACSSFIPKTLEVKLSDFFTDHLIKPGPYSAMAFNAPVDKLWYLLEIGTRTSNIALQ